MKQLVIIGLALFSSLAVFSQNEANVKSYEKFRVGVGAETLYYVDWPVNTFGYKFEVYAPIYNKLGTSFSYVRHSSYFDYCDEIPVSVSERHFTYGLTYVLMDKKKWTLYGLAGLDIERTKFTEREGIPEKAIIIHNEGAHTDDHSSTETFTEFLVGVELNYQLSNRFVLNASSRLNTYGAFRNSLNLFYQFQVKPKKENWYH